MLKVLYVSPNGYLGGAERFVLTAAYSHVNQKRVEVAILFFSSGEASKEAISLGIKCFVLSKSFRIRNLMSFFQALKEIRKLVKEFKPDVLHLTMPYAHIVLSLATIGMNLKKVWFQHGPVGERLDKIASFFPVDMIWFNSKFLKDKHHESWPKARVKKMEAVIRLGVESNKKIERTLFTNNTIRIGTAGRICFGKGFHNILIALGELKQENGLLNYQFVIAGNAKNSQDQIYNENLKNIVSSLKLEDEVRFLEHVEDMDSFYLGLDVFVHASIVPEPFGLVVAEAMVHGCLVIASDSGGVTDLMQQGVNGIMFSSTSEKSVEELKNIFKDILFATQMDLEIFRSKAKNGKLFIENNYSVESMNSQIEELYMRLYS